MADRGYLKIGSRTWNFATAKLPQHRVRWPVMATESLSTQGLDGNLIVNMQRRFLPFTVRITVSYAALTSAAQYLEDLMGSQGYFGDLRLDLFGETRIWKKCRLVRAGGRAMPDIGGGPYAVSAQAATIRATILVQPTQLPAAV